MEPPCPRVDHPGNVRWRLPREGGLWSSGSTCPGAGGTGEGPGARRRLLFLAVMPPCPPQTSLGSCQGASPTRGGGGSSCGSSPTGPRGRWKGRVLIPRAHFGANFYFWLLCLDTPPRLSGGPDEAVVRHQRTSGGVGRAGRHVRERRPRESTEKKLQNAKIFLDGPGLSYRRIARNGASLSCLRITGTGPGYPVGG